MVKCVLAPSCLNAKQMEITKRPNAMAQPDTVGVLMNLEIKRQEQRKDLSDHSVSKRRKTTMSQKKQNTPCAVTTMVAKW